MLSAKEQKLDAIMAAMTATGQQFELVNGQVNGVDYRMFKNAPPSINGFFEMSNQHGSLDCLVYRGERYSFIESLKRAKALAAYLQSDFAVSKGDRVIIAMRNYPEWMFAFMAICMLGAIAVPVNAWWKADELGYAVKDSAAALAITDAPRAAYLAQLPNDIRPKVLVARADASATAQTMNALTDDILSSGEVPQPVEVAPEDDAMILYTSGSTGFPKGAVSTHRGVVTSLMNFVCYGLAVATLEGQDVLAGTKDGPQAAALLTIPFFHVTGLIPVSLINFLIGRKLVIMHKWDAEDALKLMQEEGVTYFVGVPTMSLELLQHPRRKDFDLSLLEDIAAGGAPRPAEHVHRIKDAFPNARPGLGYGLTETNAAGAINSRDAYLERPGSTGRITTPSVEIKIAGDDGAPLPPNEVSEVWIKSAANARGYWNRPEETGEAFPGNGWFKSGDLGYQDDDGFLYIVDRKKDIIIRGGENIGCPEVEEAIFSHGDVAEASVFGLPDERLGEVVGAAVHLQQGSSVTADALQTFLGKHIAAYKIPSHIWLSPEKLPRLATGKIDKRQLKAKLMADLGLA